MKNGLPFCSACRTRHDPLREARGNGNLCADFVPATAEDAAIAAGIAFRALLTGRSPGRAATYLAAHGTAEERAKALGLARGLAGTLRVEALDALGAGSEVALIERIENLPLHFAEGQDSAGAGAMVSMDDLRTLLARHSPRPAGAPAEPYHPSRIGEAEIAFFAKTAVGTLPLLRIVARGYGMDAVSAAADATQAQIYAALPREALVDVYARTEKATA